MKQIRLQHHHYQLILQIAKKVSEIYLKMAIIFFKYLLLAAKLSCLHYEDCIWFFQPTEVHLYYIIKEKDSWNVLNYDQPHLIAIITSYSNQFYAFSLYMMHLMKIFIHFFRHMLCTFLKCYFSVWVYDFIYSHICCFTVCYFKMFKHA